MHVFKLLDLISDQLYYIHNYSSFKYSLFLILPTNEKNTTKI